MSVSHVNQVDVIEAFHSFFRYLEDFDDLLDIDDDYFGQMEGKPKQNNFR